MIEVKLTTSGLERVARRSQQASRLLAREMRTVLEPVGDDLIDQYKKNIDSFTPGSVKDLSPKYKIAKARKHAVYPILIASGDMVRSMYSKVVNIGSGKWEIRVLFKSAKNTLKAAAHLKGLGNNPVRDFSKIPRGWRAEVFNAIRSGLRRIR